MNKLKAERIHAKSRFWERFDITLNKRDYRELCEQIKSGKAQFINRQSNRVTKWLVKYKNEQIIAVYDKIRHQIITFYPLDEDYRGDISI